MCFYNKNEYYFIIISLLHHNLSSFFIFPSYMTNNFTRKIEIQNSLSWSVSHYSSSFQLFALSLFHIFSSALIFTFSLLLFSYIFSNYFLFTVFLIFHISAITTLLNYFIHTTLFYIFLSLIISSLYNLTVLLLNYFIS